MKPGLYVATVRGVEGVLALGPSSENGAYRTSEPISEYYYHKSRDVTDARPLVVLDPESDEDRQRFAHALCEVDPDLTWQNLATQLLRALAAPTPAEPLGLGAVVKDSRGVRWVRCVDGAPDFTDRPWYRADIDPAQGKWATWTELANPEVTA